MRVGSLIVLGAVFLSAFAGRAAVLAARTADTAPSGAGAARCVDGPFAEELIAQSERLEAAALEQRSEDQKRAVLLQHVNERIAELERLNGALAAAAKETQKAAQSSTKVAGLYERMKPDLAGAIIGEMDPKFAAGLLESMNADSAAGILAAIDPGRAYAITVLMTGPT